jgi:hypothetical protein
VSGIAKVAALIPADWRDQMATALHGNFDTIKSKGFYIDNKEFLYAVAHATVTLADDWRYPADSPACLAALLIKDDAEIYDEGDWGLNKAHAIKMAGLCYNSFTDTGMYAKAEDVIRLS